MKLFFWFKCLFQAKVYPEKRKLSFYLIYAAYSLSSFVLIVAAKKKTL